jgi:hypothetical protein
MKLLKEAEYMAATGFTLTPANDFARPFHKERRLAVLLLASFGSMDRGH